MKEEDKDIYILGVGRNTEVFIDLAESCGFNPIGLYHYNEERQGELIHGVRIIGSNDSLFLNNSLTGKQFAISVGDNTIRAKIAAEILKKGGILPVLIHPSAVVSKYARLENGVIIHANAVVQAGAIIGFNSVVSFNASVTHSSVVGNHCYLAAHAHVGAYVRISDHVLIGQGAVIVSSKGVSGSNLWE